MSGLTGLSALSGLSAVMGGLLSKAPDEIDGLVAWYDAALGVYQDTGKTTPATDGSKVYLWEDQSGGGHDVITSWPYGDNTHYVANDALLNNRPAINLQYGSTAGFWYDGTWSPVTGANARTIVAVGRAFQGHATAGMGHIVHWGLGTNGNAYGLTCKTSWAQKFGNHYWGSSWQAADRVDDPVILMMAYDGTVDHFRLNGGTEVTNTVTINTINGGFNIGRRVGGSEVGYGYYSEVMVYNAVLTDEDRVGLMNYLSNKYNIALS